MKQALLFFLSLLASCTPEPFSAAQTQQQIREQISAHYDSLELEGYSPISNSRIDTIAVHYEIEKVIGIIGEVTHRYRGLQGDSIAQQRQVFEVQVYVDGVVIHPAKPLPGEQPPVIGI